MDKMLDQVRVEIGEIVAAVFARGYINSEEYQIVIQKTEDVAAALYFCASQVYLAMATKESDARFMETKLKLALTFLNDLNNYIGQRITTALEHEAEEAWQIAKREFYKQNGEEPPEKGDKE